MKPRIAPGEAVAQVRADGDLVGVGEERVERRSGRETHRQRAVPAAEPAAQVRYLRSRAYGREAADLHGCHPRCVQVRRQCVGRDVARTLEVHVTGHDAYGPAVVDAARIAQIDRHVVVAPFPEALPPADLREVEGVKPPVTRDGVIVGFVLSVIGGGDLRRHQREGCRRGVSVQGVRPRERGHRHTAHAQRLGVGCGEHRLLSEGMHCGRGRYEGNRQSFHRSKYTKKMLPAAIGPRNSARHADQRPNRASAASVASTNRPICSPSAKAWFTNIDSGITSRPSRRTAFPAFISGYCVGHPGASCA